MKNFYQGAILLILSAFGFSLLPIFALYAYQGKINVTTLLLIRFSLATLILFGYVFFKYGRIQITWKDCCFLFLLGGICYNLQANCYFTSVKYIPASLAALILYTYPIIVAALSCLVEKEKITSKSGLAIGLSFIGLVMVLGASMGKMNLIGILLAFGASFVYSIYIVIGNRVVKRIPSLITSALVTLFSTFGVLVFGICTKGINFHFQAITWWPVLGLVFFSTVMAILFFFQGMERMGPTKASIMSMMEPVFTVILSTFLFHDRLTFIQLLGGFLVLTGAFLVIWWREHKIEDSRPLSRNT